MQTGEKRSRAASGCNNGPNIFRAGWVRHALADRFRRRLEEMRRHGNKVDGRGAILLLKVKVREWRCRRHLHVREWILSRLARDCNLGERSANVKTHSAAECGT